MSYSEPHVVFTPTQIGNESPVGALPWVVQGASGPITIKALNQDGSDYALDLPVTAYYWPKGSYGVEAVRVEGSISADGVFITWNISTIDTDIAGEFLIVFVHGEHKTLPVVFDVRFDAGHAVGMAPAVAPSPAVSAERVLFFMEIGESNATFEHNFNCEFHLLSIVAHDTETDTEVGILPAPDAARPRNVARLDFGRPNTSRLLIIITHLPDATF